MHFLLTRQLKASVVKFQNKHAKIVEREEKQLTEIN